MPEACRKECHCTDQAGAKLNKSSPTDSRVNVTGEMQVVMGTAELIKRSDIHAFLKRERAEVPESNMTI